MAYDESTTQFSLTQDRRSNTAMSSYMSIAHAASPFIRSGAIANGKEIIYRYSEIDRLIFSLVPKIEHYRWSFDKLSTLFEIFDELEPDLSALATKLYQINTEMTKTVDDHTNMNRLLSNIYFKRFEDITNKLKAKYPTEIADLNEEKISKLIKTRIKLYKKSVKDLQENKKGNALTDPHYTHFVYVLNKRAEMYELAKDILVRSRTLEAEQRRASRNNLYILLSVHMQCVKQEKSPEGFYINPIIEFLKSDHSAEGEISPEAKIFANIISIKYEGTEAKYEIEFNDDLHERWMLLKARFMSIENGHLLKSAECIASIESTYERFTDSFKALIDDSLPLSTLLEVFKPVIAQYKKEVAKKLNVWEDLLNKEMPASTPKKKKKKSRKAADQSEILIEEFTTLTISDSSISGQFEHDSGMKFSDSTQVGEALSSNIDDHPNADVTTKKKVDEEIVVAPSSVVSTPQQSLTAAERKKLRKDAKRLERAKQEEDSKQTTEESKADELSTANKNSTPAEQMRLDRERQKAVRERIAAQQAREKQKKDAELAAYNAQKAREKENKLAEKGLAPQDNSSKQIQLIVEKPKKPVDQGTTTTSGMDKPAAKAFAFNTNAPEFTPKSKIVTLPGALERQEEQGSEQPQGITVNNGQYIRYPGGSTWPYTSIHGPYMDAYQIWLAQQQYYALQMQQGYGYY